MYSVSSSENSHGHQQQESSVLIKIDECLELNNEGLQSQLSIRSDSVSSNGKLEVEPVLL